MRRAPQMVAAALAIFALGCGGASSDPGLNALMRATGAQYAPGELMEDMGAAGPTVDAISTNSTTVKPGLPARSLTGSASSTATAVLVGLSGDDAHWIVPMGIEDSEQVGNYTFQTTLSFSSDLPAGPRNLVFRAVDAGGQLGASRLLPIKVPLSLPSGALVVSLQWDTEADLDLHLQVPNAADPTMPLIVWSRAPLALPSDPKPTADAVMTAGQLDGDSNSGCIIDGRRQEDVVFPVAPAPAPPTGDYVVRVDAPSMCGQGVARWHALAVVDGDVDNPAGEAFGQVTDFDASRAHAASSGVIAFTFSFGP
jgi:hypothetical protein